MRNARFGWIEACLRYVGYFGMREKRALQDAFGVSESSACRDQEAFLGEFLRRSGEDLVEKRRGRLYVREGAQMPEMPLFEPPDLKSWLTFMLDKRQHISVTGFGRAQPSSHVLGTIIRSIQDKRPVKMAYLSRTQGAEARLRTVSPHALVDVVGRYHMRAYDHEKARYADFVLSRILNCIVDISGESAYVGSSHDREWNAMDVVEIVSVSKVSLEAARRDFGLDDSGRRSLSLQRAISPYVIDNPAESYASPVQIRIVSDHQKV